MRPSTWRGASGTSAAFPLYMKGIFPKTTRLNERSARGGRRASESLSPPKIFETGAGLHPPQGKEEDECIWCARKGLGFAQLLGARSSGCETRRGAPPRALSLSKDTPRWKL